MTLIDYIEPNSNLHRDERNLQILVDNWMDQLETLDLKFGLNWRDRKSEIKIPGQRKIFRLKSWSSEDGLDKVSTNVEKSSTNLIKKTPKTKSLNSGSLQVSNTSSKSSTLSNVRRRKSPTVEVKSCIRELETFGTVKETTTRSTLIETMKYLNDELKRQTSVIPEKNVSSVWARQSHAKPLKLPKLEKSA